MRHPILVFLPLLLAASHRAAEPAPPALAGLTYSGDQQALDALDRDIAAAGNDATRLAAIEKQLLGVLRRTDAAFAARQAAAQRVGRVLAFGPARTSADAFKPLGAMLIDDRDSDLARLALEPATGEIIDAMFVDALEKTRGRTRLGIIDSIARRRATAAVKPLAKLLQDSDPATAAGAARALGEIADPTSVAALHAFPEPSAAPIATAKLAAASRLPPAAALGLLNELQRNARDPVHRAAAFRLSLDVEVGAAATRIADVLSGQDWLMKQVAVESIARSPAPNLVSTLADKLGTWDPPTQQAVIAALGRRREAVATNAIVTAAKHNDPDVRATAIEALGLLPGTRDTTALLAGAVASSDSTEAKIARQALARLNGPEVSPTIIAGAERGENRLRVVYLEQFALRNMTETLPLLRKCRGDRDAEIRVAAVAALGDIAPATEEKALLEWTVGATDSAEQTRALRSLVNVILRNPGTEDRGRDLLALIDTAPAELALRLLPALGRIGGNASAATAARLATREDAALSDGAVAALTRWTDTTALPALATVAETASRPEARSAAVDGVLRYFERNRDPWSAKNTAVISRVLARTDKEESRRKLVALLHRADDREALALAERLKSDPAVGAQAAMAAEVVRANLAGPPKLRASTSSGVANMMDGKTSTRWTTPALGEEWIEVEFKRARPIVRITLDQTGRAAEFPEQYEVFVTDNPKQPGNAVASGTGQRNKTVIELPTGTRGRYVIVKNIAERKDAPWAVCELYVD